MPKDFFAGKAEEYDKKGATRENARKVAKFVRKNVALSKDMHLMDFGAGSGLFLAEIAPYVRKITAVDVSSDMIEVLKSKGQYIDCEIDILEIDLTQQDVDIQFDGIVSSMTCHHIKNISKLFIKFYSLLKSDGIIAIADLDLEDGNFHSSNEGVCHFGFDRESISYLARQVGFKDIKIETATTYVKSSGNYTVFLLTAKK